MLATQDRAGGGLFEPFVLARRQTPMTASELNAALEELLGKKYTLRQAANALNCDVNSLFDWLSGESEIPASVISTVELAKDCPPHKRIAAWHLPWLINAEKE
jgi:hypothetical protein